MEIPDSNYPDKNFYSVNAPPDFLINATIIFKTTSLYPLSLRDAPVVK